MSLMETISEVEYPESDGRPMGETDLHRSWMIRIFDWLSYRHRGERVYVACDLLLYYVEGDPHQFVVPDVFLVKDCVPTMRDSFQIWREQASPDVVFEVTSRSTKKNDQTNKPDVYKRIGVKEYFLYDPTSEYLRPTLQGHRLVGHDYKQLTLEDDQSLESRELGLRLRLLGRQLVMYDIRTGQPLLTEVEAKEQAREAEQRAREAEQRAREAAERQLNVEAKARRAAEERANAAEEELRKLREQLRKSDEGN